MILRGVPHLKTISELVGAASNRIESEVALDLVPQILAQACSAIAAGQPGQNRPDEAIVLIRREVELFVVDADRIPLVKQVAKLVCAVSEAVLIDLRVRHADILTDRQSFRLPAGGSALTVRGTSGCLCAFGCGSISPVAADKHDVIEVLRRLLGQWEAGEPARWENVTVPAYIEAMAAWLEGYEQVYINTGRQIPTDGWTVFAAALQAAAIYE
jgi:hypothetical protein